MIPVCRRWGIRLFTVLTRAAAGTGRFGDAQCGYTAASRALLHHIHLDTLYHGYGFPNHMLIRVIQEGYRICEVPVRPIYGDETSGIRPLTDLPRLFFQLGRRAFGRRVPDRRPTGRRAFRKP